jgi:hypothetical protein
MCYRYFVGCCDTNPCEITCPQGNLHSASFDKAYYGKFSDATCGLGSDFWTCIFASKTPDTFMGCCKGNACAGGGCFGSNLTGAILGTDSLRSEYGAVGVSSSSSSLSSATRFSSTFVTTATSGAITATNSAESAPAPKKEPVAAIAGGAAGGALALAAVVALFVYYFCHAKKSRKGHDDSIAGRLPDVPDMIAAQEGLRESKPHNRQSSAHSRIVVELY